VPVGPGRSTGVETLDVGRDVDAAAHLTFEFKSGAGGNRAFIDAVLAGLQVEPSFLDGLKAQQVIAVGYIAAREPRWVDVPQPSG
jgi:predicted dehydrogenase